MGGNDLLEGGHNQDWLDGGEGNDTLNGGEGDDTYVGASHSDTLIAEGPDGTDTVFALIDWTLGTNFEHMVLGGVGDIDGTGNGNDNTMTGNSGKNKISGVGGNDTLAGGAGNDRLFGGTGDDILVWQASDSRVDGGANADTLKLTGAQHLNLVNVVDTRITAVEKIDMAGTNTLTLGASDVLAISTTDTLTVNGNGGDSVTAMGNWTSAGMQGAYEVYTLGGATLRVHQLIDLTITVV
jgi:Ca2+-binding RTX toxin-like protein